MQLAIKIDVDTEKGTALGVPALADLLSSLDVPATFLFSLGPDNTGRALKRLLRSGFLVKCLRSRVVANYGLRTLGNGVLWKGPMIARRHHAVLRRVADLGFEVGIHAWDHTYWQDRVHSLSGPRIDQELDRAVSAFHQIFGHAPAGIGAPGWQACQASLQAVDRLGFAYASDCRGRSPFLPRIAGYVAELPQIPTTLPTLDEVLGLPGASLADFTQTLIGQMHPGLNVMTAHAELEGGAYLEWFAGFLRHCRHMGVTFQTLRHCAANLPGSPPICDLVQAPVPGRSGCVAMQGEQVIP